MVKTHKTVTKLDSQEKAKNYIRENFGVSGRPTDDYAVSVPNKGHSSPAVSYPVEDEAIRYVHALSTGHVIIRYDKDSGRGYGPHSDQKNPTGRRDGHPR